jgi:hypothetical protein
MAPDNAAVAAAVRQGPLSLPPTEKEGIDERLPDPRRPTLVYAAGGRRPMSPAGEPYVGLLFFAFLWAFASASVVGTIGPEWRWRRAAWSWLASFVASSLIAAYYFWRLL